MSLSDDNLLKHDLNLIFVNAMYSISHSLIISSTIYTLHCSTKTTQEEYNKVSDCIKTHEDTQIIYTHKMVCNTSVPKKIECV